MVDDSNYKLGYQYFSFKLTIVCAITIVTAICLALSPKILVQIKGDNSVISGNPTILVNKGLALDNLVNYTGAIVYYDKALAIDPHYINALTNKGVTLGKLGNYTGAILYFDKALAIDPYYVYALTNKGLTLGILGNYTGAIEYHDKALAIDPHNVYALTNKGLLFQ